MSWTSAQADHYLTHGHPGARDIVNRGEHCRPCKGTGREGSGTGNASSATGHKVSCDHCRGTGFQTVKVGD